MHGADGLPIADLAGLPDVPGRGPAATAVTTGEEMADLVAGGAVVSPAR